jgi:hypothetical protein
LRAFALALVAALAATSAPSGAARALEARIEGTIENATAGGPGDAEYVRLLRLKEGMEPLAVLENVSGSFLFSGVAAEAGDPLLVQAASGGVTYSKQVTLDASGAGAVSIVVYDTTSSWNDVRVARYQIGLAVETEMLRVFKVIEVMVEGHPPRAVVGEPGAFRFPVQAGLLQMGVATAQHASLPLTVEPIALEGSREYAISYPLRPGKTEFQIQYDLKYNAVGTVFSEALPYAVEEMNALVVPESIAITSELLADQGIDAHNNIHLFSGRDIPAGVPVVLRLSGEGAPSASRSAQGGMGADGGASAGSGDAGGAGRVVRVPNRMTSLRVITIAGVLVTLGLGTAFALTRPPAEPGRAAAGRRASDPAALARRESILDRIVALDAKHRAGEISEYAYWQKREALKATLVELLEESGRARPGGAGSGRAHAERAGSARERA